MRGVSGPPAPTEDARAGSAAPATTPMEGVSGLSASGPAPPSPAPSTQGASSYSSDEGSIDGSGGDESDGDVGLDSALPPPPPPPRLTDEGINKLWRDFMEEQDVSLAQGQTTDLLTHRVGDLYRLLRSHFVQLRKLEHRYVDVRDAMAELAEEKMPALIDLFCQGLDSPLRRRVRRHPHFLAEAGVRPTQHAGRERGGLPLRADRVHAGASGAVDADAGRDGELGE